MAIEIGLHKVNDGHDFTPIERRNRERTFLVLFIQDRTLAMLLGNQAMLQEVIIADAG